MPYNIGAPVSFGYALEDFMFTYLLSGTITAADVGKAVMLDTAAPNTVKLTQAAEDVIFGRLETFEDRTTLGIKVGTVSRKFKDKLPKAANVITVGQSVAGSAVAGIVKAAASQNTLQNIVIEVGTDFVVVEKL
jgi:nanoRNase/pAp phosphatase (c-di-AMP/oligoRNAs hydrolase)